MFKLELDEEAKSRVSDYIYEIFLASRLLDRAVRNLLGMSLDLSEQDIRLLAGNVKLEVQVREGKPMLQAVPLSPVSLPDRGSVSYRMSPMEESSCLGASCSAAMIALMGVWSEPSNANYVPTEEVGLPELVVLPDGNIVHKDDLPALLRELMMVWYEVASELGGDVAVGIHVEVIQELRRQRLARGSP